MQHEPGLTVRQKFLGFGVFLTGLRSSKTKCCEAACSLHHVVVAAVVAVAVTVVADVAVVM